MNKFDINMLLDEVSFNFSRSGGKGGQNVNKVETKVELIFNIQLSSALDEQTKDILLKKLSARLDKEGSLHVVCQAERSQMANRKNAIKKFELILQKALKPEKKRKKTKKSESVKRKILEKKRIHGNKKKERKKVVELE